MSAGPPSAAPIGHDLQVEDLSVREFKRVAHALFTDAGITMPDSKLTLVHSRLSKRLRALKMQRFEDYCDFIESPAGAIERRSLLTALTTNVTRFFREPHHFDVLKAELLPPLLRKAKQGARVRLWSAGCSSGEEPYSIAMSLLSLAPDAANYDIRILASDIDPNILSKAKRGLYSEGQMKGLGRDLRAKYFVRSDGGLNRENYQVRDTLKQLVSFRELNLTKKWPFAGPFDIIFCRNVVIYFNEPTAQKVWSQFASVMAPGSYLMVGHSERVSGPALGQFSTSGVTTYKRK